MDNLVVQCYSLFTKKMLANWEKFVNQDILGTCNDDRTYLYVVHMNGYELRPCTKWCVSQPNGSNVSQLQAAPKSDYRYLVG